MFQRSPRHTLIALLACICVGPQGAAAHASPPVSLTQLEDRARAFAPSARLAQADVTVAEQRSAALQAGSGAQLFGGAGVDNAREAVTDTLSRDYQRTQMHLGVRWPLLGTRAAQQRTVDDAQHAVEQSRLRRLQMENEAVLAVRRAYVRHLRSVERIRLADAFLRVRAEAQEQLASRHAAGVLLEADRLDLGGLFNIVQATHDSQSAARDLARAEIERLTGQPAAAVQTQEPAWPQTCLAPGAAALDRSPAVTLAQQEVDAAQRRQQHARLEGVQASVSLAQSFTRDIGGPTGHSTRVGVDFSLPLQWRSQRDAALAQAQGEIDRAQALLALRRSELEAAAQQALATYRLRDKEMAGHQHRQQAAAEALRIAQLRLNAFDGDGYSKLLTTRYALYQAAVQVVDGAERRDLAALDVLALGDGCTLAWHDAPAAPDPWAATVAALAGGTAPASAKAVPGETGLGWYVWQGQALLDQPAQLDELPPRSRRLLLSFTAAQLQALARPDGRARWMALRAQAQARQLTLELLLGEPTWVLPHERARLLALVESLRDLPADALHLDLERSQLPAAQQRDWSRHLIDTLQAVRAAAPWPLALTTHYRELQQPGFAARVHAAGVGEVVAMLYVNNPERTATLARPLLSAAPAGLRIAVAQSIESALPAQESSFTLGKARSLQRWDALAHQLAGLPGFGGVVVQSWEDYREARP